MILKLILLFAHMLLATGLVFGQLPDEKLQEKTNSSLGNQIAIDLFGGGMMFLFPTSFDGVYSPGNKFDPSFSPSAGINFIYMISKSKRLGMGLSVAYNRYKADLQKVDSIKTVISSNYYFTTNYNESLEIKNSLLAIDIYMLYFINSSGPIRFFAKTGFLNNVSFGNAKTIVSQYSSTTTGIRNGNIPISFSESGSKEIIPLTESWPSLSIALGLKKGKSKLDLIYVIPRDIYASPSRDKKFKIGSLGFNYYYQLH